MKNTIFAVSYEINLLYHAFSNRKQMEQFVTIHTHLTAGARIMARFTISAVENNLKYILLVY